MVRFPEKLFLFHLDANSGASVADPFWFPPCCRTACFLWWRAYRLDERHTPTTGHEAKIRLFDLFIPNRRLNGSAQYLRSARENHQEEDDLSRTWFAEQLADPGIPRVSS